MTQAVGRLAQVAETGDVVGVGVGVDGAHEQFGDGLQGIDLY